MSPKSDGAAAIAVARQIRVVRGQRVLLDEDLAAIYGVTTSALNQAMRRNRGRFPPDFVLELTESEWESLRSQIVILKTGRGRHRKYLPVAFTEHGAVMAATILNSPQAVQMSILVVRAFIAMRSALQDSTQLAAKLDALEKSLAIMDADTRRQFKELRAVVFALAAPPAKEQ
jgi:hypothetical protein